jgi:hypothetical protein
MLTSIDRDGIRSRIASKTLICSASAGVTGDLLRELWNPFNSSDNLVSHTFLSRRVQTMRFLGIPPEERHAFRFVSEATALRLAAECYLRAREDVEIEGEPQRAVVGIGITAAVDTEKTRRGDQRVHIALRTAEGFFTLYGLFTKQENGRAVIPRAEQGAMCDLLALNALFSVTGCGGWSYVQPGITYPDAASDYGGVPGSVLREKFSRGDVRLEPFNDMLFLDSDGSSKACSDARDILDPESCVIFPGSYHWAHHGHYGTADLVRRMTGKRVIYQITQIHPDKGIVDDVALYRRAMQFAYRDPVLVLREGSLYVQKAKLLPGFSFLIGADAAFGLLNPKYYDGQQGLMNMLETLRRLKTRFYVMGREVDGTYRTLEDIPIPGKYRHLFLPVSGRFDVSSSAIRSAAT